MKEHITVHEANTEEEVASFWRELHEYHKRDIFPNPEDYDELKYFLDDSEYRMTIDMLHERETDRAHYLFFMKNGERIGFALSVIYTSEDGKLFIMEFCVFPEFRGEGTGRECAAALLAWSREKGASYAELNCNSERRARFWESVGFIKNGADEWGEPLMILPPTDDVPITVEMLTDHEDWQLLKLENGYLSEIGESTLTEAKQEKLMEAVHDGKIAFFVAKRGYRAVGMCSVTTAFSTFSCSNVGFFEDFYIEPAFRKSGIAKKLVLVAKKWCAEHNVSSLGVCCAECDEKMYRHLGFDTHLGSTYALLI